MLGLLGIRLHPALRALIGGVLLVLGLTSHRVGLSIVGGVFLGWAMLGVLGGGCNRRKDESAERHFP